MAEMGKVQRLMQTAGTGYGGVGWPGLGWRARPDLPPCAPKSSGGLAG